MYGTQASPISISLIPQFENDVKMYGTQAAVLSGSFFVAFENDVKMYGTQATGFRRVVLCQDLVQVKMRKTSF